jgi:hypothetical protein
LNPSTLNFSYNINYNTDEANSGLFLNQSSGTISSSIKTKFGSTAQLNSTTSTFLKEDYYFRDNALIIKYPEGRKKDMVLLNETITIQLKPNIIFDPNKGSHLTEIKGEIYSSQNINGVSGKAKMTTSTFKSNSPIALDYKTLTNSDGITNKVGTRFASIYLYSGDKTKSYSKKVS